MGVESFDSRIFLSRKIWQVFFWWLDLSRYFLGGIQNNLKIHVETAEMFLGVSSVVRNDNHRREI